MMKSNIICYLVSLAGLFLMGLGIALITKSNLGTSPISSIPYVLSMIFPVSFGQFTFLLSILFLLIEILLFKAEFPKSQYLQILVGPFFGLFTDLGMRLFSFVKPDFYVAKLIVLLLGCIILALGVHLEIAANVIVNPGEGVVKAIANKTGKDFGTVKIMFDSSLCFLAMTTSLFVFQTIKGLREGTLISALLVGYITNIFSKTFRHLKVTKMANH